MVVFFSLQKKWSGLVLQARPNQPQPGSLLASHTDTESNPRWGWLGLACETLILKAISAGVGWVWLARLGLGVLQSGNVIIVIGITC